MLSSLFIGAAMLAQFAMEFTDPYGSAGWCWLLGIGAAANFAVAIIV